MTQDEVKGARCRADVEAALNATQAAEQLHRAAVRLKSVRGWRTGTADDLLRSLFYIAQYDLAVCKHATKRQREEPIDVCAWGALAATQEPVDGAERLRKG